MQSKTYGKTDSINHDFIFSKPFQQNFHTSKKVLKMSNKSKSQIKLTSNKTKINTSLIDFLLEKWNKEYQSKVRKNTN